MSVLTRAPKLPSWAVTVLAGALVWLALVAPDGAGPLSPRDFARIPLEGLLVLTLALVLPPRARRGMALLSGLLLGLLTIVRLLDAVFFAALGRPFSPVADWGYLGSGVGLLTSSVGRLGAALSVLAAVALGVALLVLMPLAVVRLTQLIDRHRATSARALTALGVAWLLCTVLGVELVPGAPVAATGEARLVYTKVTQARADARAQRAFALAAELDPLRSTRDADLLTGLRGKDVIVAFVESYGRVAVQGSPFSASVASTLDAGTSRLGKAGFSSRSAFLTSPTFGGISWLAHSTLQSGLWVDSQRRYDDLMATDRATLSATFKRAGWRTVGDVPSNRQDWPDGTSFYRYDTVYDARNVGYAGPGFSYASMPDQYVLSAFQRLELVKPGHRPVMAEIDLVSSHTPWTPLPHLLDWGDVGNGSVFSAMDGGPPAAGRLARPRPGAGRLREVHRVLAQHPHLLRAQLPRQQRPGAGRAGRPPACDGRLGSGRQPRRAHHGHRPRPSRDEPHLGLGLAGRPEATPRRAGLAHGRLPRPLPHRVRTTPAAGNVGSRCSCAALSWVGSSGWEATCRGTRSH